MPKNQNLKNNKGVRLWNKSKKIIPGGSQLLSKRAEMFLPEQWPSYFSKAKGTEVFDLEGNKYLDTYSSVGASILGYADSDINKAVKKVIDKGSISTLNCPEEVELAELLLKLHPWAQQARFARTGGEAMAVAVRIARASTKRDKIIFCGYHGWHDWYLAANLADDNNLDGHLLAGLQPRGVPKGLRGTAMPFHYNNIEELQKIVEKGNEVAAIVMEPVRNHEPENDFLGKVKEIANRIGAVLIFDEITIGWRLTYGGAHLKYKVNPDIAVFAKGMSNGFPMAAIIGKKNVMEASQETFISSSYWTEKIGPAAAITAIKKMIKHKVPSHLDKIGNILKEGIKKSAEKTGLKVNVYGLNPLVHIEFLYEDENLAVRTLFTQEMLKRKILASGGIYLNYSFKKHHAEKYLKAVEEVFFILSKGIKDGNINKLLNGPVAQKGFQRLT